MTEFFITFIIFTLLTPSASMLGARIGAALAHQEASLFSMLLQAHKSPIVWGISIFGGLVIAALGVLK